MLKKLVTLLFCCFPFLVFAQKLIDADFERTPLKELIQVLEDKHAFVFSYTDDLITERRLSIRFAAKPWREALQLIFAEAKLSVEIVDETYIVLRALPREAFSICGKITDEQGTALAYANIFSLSTLQGTSADETGHFNWRGDMQPMDSVEISYVGLLPVRMSAAQLQDCPVVTLRQQTFSFSEVIVKEYITSGIEQAEELDHVVLKPQKIKVVPGLTEADVLQMIQILPGVQSPDESAAGLHIRGGTPDQNLILWDGVPVYNTSHFFGMISAFNPYLVDKVSVYRSGFPAAYGGRVASVIDIQSIETVPERIQANVGLNFTHADLSTLVPFGGGKSALILSARRAYTDIVQSPTYRKLSQRVFQKSKIDETQDAMEDDETINSELDFNFIDLNAKWIWQANKKNKFALSAFRIFDKLDFLVSNSEDDFQSSDKVNLDNVGGSAKWEKQWSTNFSSNFLASYSKVENKVEYAIGEQDTASLELNSFQLNDIEDVSFKLDQRWQVRPAWALNFGYQFSDLTVKRQYLFEEEDGEVIADRNRLHMGHLTVVSRLSNKLRLHTGLRLTFATGHERSYWEPRFSVHYFPSKKWQFKAAFGDYRQFIGQAIELNDLGLSQEIWVLTEDEDEIPVTGNRQFSAGFLFNVNTFQFELEGFYKQLSGLTSFSPVFLNNNFQEEEDGRGTGEAWGVDLLIKKRWKNYETWLSYTYGRVFYTFDIYNQQTAFAAPHDRPHSLTSMHQFKYKRWNFSLSWKYASGKVYTTADDFFVEDDGDAFPLYNYDRTNENRLPAFHRLDLSILYRFKFRSDRLSAMLGVSALNLYNRTNILSREYLVFSDDDDDFVLERLDRPMLPFTPNIVCRFFWK